MPHVIKLGGSLLDPPDLVERFEAYRRAEMGTESLLVVGGGAVADRVRELDRSHHLEATTAHWLAVRAMQFNSRLVAAVLPHSRMVAGIEECASAWADGALAVMDPLSWLEGEERRGICLPKRWSCTSDSIAAHAAVRLGARLTLLKSTLPGEEKAARSLVGQPPIIDRRAAFAAGIVDGDFPAASAALPEIELINFRAQPLRRCILR